MAQQAQRAKSKTRRSKTARKSAPGGLWLVVPIGLALAVTAGYLILLEPGGGPAAVGSAPSPAANGLHSEIDEASRAKLRDILRAADREDAP